MDSGTLNNPPPPTSLLEKTLGNKGVVVEHMAGDGSSRTYYRIKPSSASALQSFVLMQLRDEDRKALAEDRYDWITLARTFQKQTVPIPEIFHVLPESGSIILEDCGSLMLSSLVDEAARSLKWESIEPSYGQAFELIGQFLNTPSCPHDGWSHRGLFPERLLWELNLFWEKHVEAIPELRKKTLKMKEGVLQEFLKLSEHIGKEAYTLVHRDFHSRNLMVHKNKLFVIDFQDAQKGPAAYDLMSLCFDPYTPFSVEHRLALLNKALEYLKPRIDSYVFESMVSSWKLVMLQRLYKAIGSYSFLTLEKKRGNYAPYRLVALKMIQDITPNDANFPLLTGAFLKTLVDYEKPTLNRRAHAQKSKR